MKISIRITAVNLVVFSSCFVGPVLAQSLTNFAGPARSVLFSTPAELILQKDPSGVVTDIIGCDRFESKPGQVSVQANGSFTGSDIPGTGQLSWAGPGLINATVPGNMASFIVNESADFLASVARNAEGWIDVNLILRSPATFRGDDLTNTTWSLLMLDTPAQLQLLRETNGAIFEIEGRNGFGTETGSMQIDANGNISGIATTPFTATAVYAGNGQIDLTINQGGQAPFPLSVYINAGQNLMVGLPRMLSSQDNFQELIFFVRVPAQTTLGDLAGIWRVRSLETPSALFLDKDSQMRLRDVIGKEDFYGGGDSIVVGQDGFFVANGEDPAIGMINLGAGGQVSVTLTNVNGRVMGFGFRLNAAKDAMISAGKDGSLNSLNILTKAPPVPDSRQDFGLIAVPGNGVLDVYWASSSTRELQRSTNTVDWETVAGSAGQHSFKGSMSGTNNVFYRVVQRGA